MEQKDSKEINLLELLALFTNWLKKIAINVLVFFGNVLKLLFRHKITVIVIVVICIAVGEYFARPSEKVYKAEAEAELFGVEASEVKELLKPFESPSVGGAVGPYGTLRHLPDSVASNVQQIQAYYYIDYLRFDNIPDYIDYSDRLYVKDTANIRMKDITQLRVVTKKPSQVPQVQAALLNFLNTNKSVVAKYNVETDMFKEKIRISQKELNRIDSMAKLVYFKNINQQVGFENNKLIVGEERKQMFYGELLDLQSIISKSRLALNAHPQPVTLTTGNFVVDPKPLNGYFRYGVIGMIVGFVFSILIAFVIENFTKFLKFLKS